MGSGLQLYCDCEHGARKHRQHYQRIHERFDHAGVPNRLRFATLATLADTAGADVYENEAVRAVRDIIRKGETGCPRYGGMRSALCILGANGRGKTGLLVILARAAYRAGYTPLFIKYHDLIRGGIQAGYGTYTSEGVELSHIRLQTAQRISHLCLDDLGDPFCKSDINETRDRRDLLFQVLSARHERGLITHFTANFDSLQGIARQFDPRIADRIKEMCAVVEMGGQNLRESA
jgi:DNA replication protein DnaC